MPPGGSREKGLNRGYQVLIVGFSLILTFLVLLILLSGVILRSARNDYVDKTLEALDLRARSVYYLKRVPLSLLLKMLGDEHELSDKEILRDLSTLLGFKWKKGERESSLKALRTLFKTSSYVIIFPEAGARGLVRTRTLSSKELRKALESRKHIRNIKVNLFLLLSGGSGKEMEMKSLRTLERASKPLGSYLSDLAQEGKKRALMMSAKSVLILFPPVHTSPLKALRLAYRLSPLTFWKWISLIALLSILEGVLLAFILRGERGGKEEGKGGKGEVSGRAPDTTSKSAEATAGAPSQGGSSEENPSPLESTGEDTSIFKDYLIDRKIGEGGMAVVYLAYKLRNGVPDKSQPYALKIMTSFVDEEAYQRFLREIEISYELKHPNIIRVFEGGVWNNKPYIVMEYIDGTTLDKLIKEGNLSLEDKLAIMKKICYGLSYAHQKGIIHRDIKPSNILVSKDLKKIKLTDFGLAKMLIKKSITLAGTTLGTPYYMAPEQLESKNVDHRADIYSLGVTFYELLSGKLPFEGDPVSIIYKHLKEKPKPLRELVPDIPPELDIIVMKMLEKNPDRRYKSVDEVLKALDLVIQKYIRGGSQKERPRESGEPSDV